MRTSTKLGLLACLYFAQGLPFGFFLQALPAILRKEEFSLQIIGLTTLLNLPWGLKFLWAPLVDHYHWGRLGRRRSWLLPIQMVSVVVLLALSWVDPTTGFALLLVGVFLTNLMAATQDIATDALAVELLHPEERGPGNGVQVAAYRVGMIVSGGVLLIFYDELGWQITFLTLASLLIVATLPVVLYREPQAQQENVPSLEEAALGLLRRPGIALWLTAIGVFKAGDWLANTMFRPMLVDQGLTLAEIGWLLGTVGATAGLLGAMVGGILTTFLGRTRAVVVFGLFQAVSVAGYVLPALGMVEWEVLYPVCALEHFAGGTATAALFTLMMDACDRRTAATDYTLQASVVVLASLGAAAVSGYSAEAVGYALHFAIAVGVCLGGVLLIAFALSQFSASELRCRDA